MTSFVGLLQQEHSWLFVPSAVLLGALHGLEPGHSKTMMAAFIVAIRGTLAQAVLLALSATVSHTLIVWAVALAGLYFGRSWSSETSEPYFQLASAVLIVAIAAWMLWRTRRQLGGQRAARAHGDSHSHGGARRIDTGHGIVRLEIHAQGAAPRFRLYPESGAGWPAGEVEVETERADGSREQFRFRRHGDHLESLQLISAPHEFVARLRLGPAHHRHDYDVEFVEGRRAHALGGYEGLDLTAPGYQDPHELAHANDIRHRFAHRDATTAQIVVFGLTGGLIPCPASITVLLLCLQLKKLALGATLVLCFSVGLALTLMTAGAVAALGVRHAAKRFRSFGKLARRAPYFSGALILMVGAYVGYQGLHVLI